MTRYFLTNLTIEGFRGINNENKPLDINFKPDAVNSVFAVNGIGKSSIFDALQYAIHGCIPKLEALKTRERPQDYYCNHFHSKKSASIVMKFQPDDDRDPVVIKVDRDAVGNKTITSPSGCDDPERFLSMFKEAFALLDYRKFIRFIEESPLERGRDFSDLLGLAEYSDCRRALQAASDTRTLNTDIEISDMTTAVDTAQKETQKSLTDLKSICEKVAGKPMESKGKPDEYVAEVTAALGSEAFLKPHIADKSLNEIDFEKIKEAIKTAEGGDRRHELGQIIETLPELEALATYDITIIGTEQKNIGELIDKREELLASTRGDLFKRLYESAKEVISEDDWVDEEKCPLCESNLSFSISGHVSEQLDQYTAVVGKNLEIKNAWQASTWKKYLSAQETAAHFKAEKREQKLSMLDGKFSSSDISKDDLAAIVEWTSRLTAKTIDTLRAAKDRKALLEGELPPSLVHLIEKVEYGRRFTEALKIYQDNQWEEATKQKHLSIRERWKSFISRATKVFADAETTLSEARINGISAEHKSMFGEIMNVNDVVPDLRRFNDREDLDIQLSDFHGKHELSANALLSESYRNALAISVFLAAALRHSGAPRFVMLDDVTSSFDSGHQLRLMELIRTKLQQPHRSDGLQFIILSHDGSLEKYFERLSDETNWHHNKLQGLPPTGAVMHQAQEVEHLKTTIESFLSDGNTTSAEVLIRQYLEYKLLQIIRKVGIPVPIDFAIKDTSRMVGNCLDAIQSAIDLYEKAKTLVLDDQQISNISTVHMPAIVSNWVNHYETSSSSNLSVPVLQGVITSIDELAECFKYDDKSSGSPGRRWYKSLSKR